MRIGKTIKTVTSPKREVRKAVEKPIPVTIPTKVPQTAEIKWSYRLGWGLSPLHDVSVVRYTPTS